MKVINKLSQSDFINADTSYNLCAAYRSGAVFYGRIVKQKNAVKV